jgi:hypothetical protein
MLKCFTSIKHSKHHVYDKNNCCSKIIIIYKVLPFKGR